MELNFSLHPAQIKIFNSGKRFRCVSAGRRFGKSYLSAIELLIHGLEDENYAGHNVRTKDVYYIAPTFQQAKDIMWRLIKELGKGVIQSTLENTGVINLINGRKIHLKGSDRPDTLRGVGLSFVVMDEYASMKSDVWEQIIRPALSDVQGRALFIGTPAGKNHFYDLFMAATEDDDWEAFAFASIDNPFIPQGEVEAAKKSLSSEIFRQEYEASFQSFGSKIFKEDWVQYGEEPKDGNYYIAVDLAGFSDVVKKSEKRLDEHAIAVVKTGTFGWYVKDIIHGRWNVRKTAHEIMKAAHTYRPLALGIEKGALKNACMPYIEEEKRRLGVYPVIHDLTHGNQRKTERITWALQGRFEHGRIKFAEGAWNQPLVDQLVDFPNPLAHDDLVDALAYIDQLSSIVYSRPDNIPEWQPLDDISGF